MPRHHGSEQCRGGGGGAEVVPAVVPLFQDTKADFH
jgi:hypothetical protein